MRDEVLLAQVEVGRRQAAPQWRLFSAGLLPEVRESKNQVDSMIDQDNMRALAARLRDESSPTNGGRNVAREVIKEAADAIDLLLAEVEASDQKRKEAVLDAEKARDERNRVHVKLNAEWVEKTNALRAELESFKQAVLDPENQPSQYGTVLLEAAAADKRDAERYRALRDFGKDGVNMKPPVEHVHAMIYSHLVGAVPASRVANGDELDRAIDAALAQRQGEGS